VASGGSLTVPAKKLYEIVKALPDTDVRIEEDKSGVKIAADRFDSRLQTLPREDFPTVPAPTYSEYFQDQILALLPPIGRKAGVEKDYFRSI